MGNGVENVNDVSLRQTTTIYDILRHSTTTNDNLRQPTTIYDNLRQSTTTYDILRQPTAFYDKSTTFYDNLRHVYDTSTTFTAHTSAASAGFFETFASIRLLLLTFTVMMNNIEDWLAQVHGMVGWTDRDLVGRRIGRAANRSFMPRIGRA
jgi:hypothetical protein